jgi:hypothetical protein
MRHEASASLMRSSWHLGPIEGIGLECGIPKHFAPLQPSEQVTRLQSGNLGEGWGLDLSVQPDKRLVVRAHRAQCMSNLTCRQPGNLALRFGAIG